MSNLHSPFGRVLSRRAPRGIVSGVRADLDPGTVLAGLRASVDGFKADFSGRVDTIEASVDKLITKMAGMIAAGGSPSGHRDPRTSNPNIPAYARAFNSYFRGGEHAVEGGAHALRELEVKAALSVGSNPDGGYTVLPEIEQSILNIAQDVSPIRGLANTITIGGDAYETVVNTTMSQVKWVGEKDARNPTDGPSLRKIRIPACEMQASPQATQSLLDDSFIDMGAWLTTNVTTAMAQFEGAAFAGGAGGAIQPRGFLTENIDPGVDFVRPWNSIQYAAAGGTSPTDTQLADAIVSMASLLRTPYLPNAKWLLNRNMLRTVRTVKDSTGKYLLSTDGRLADGAPATLVGFEYVICDDMPDPAPNSLPLALADWKQAYYVIDRIGIRVLRDPFTAKPFVTFDMTKRVGGATVDYNAIKLLKYSAS